MKLTYHELCEKLFTVLKKWDETERSIKGKPFDVWRQESKIFTKEWDDAIASAQWTDNEFWKKDNQDRHLDYLINSRM